ncbi:hypothetical protein KM043_002475 [Ampulex compressa]|nr:hypothetical protein KM043_002475 [Ampulex compressa]
MQIEDIVRRRFESRLCSLTTKSLDADRRHRESTVLQKETPGATQTPSAIPTNSQEAYRYFQVRKKKKTSMLLEIKSSPRKPAPLIRSTHSRSRINALGAPKARSFPAESNVARKKRVQWLHPPASKQFTSGRRKLEARPPPASSQVPSQEWSLKKPRCVRNTKEGPGRVYRSEWKAKWRTRTTRIEQITRKPELEGGVGCHH